MVDVASAEYDGPIASTLREHLRDRYQASVHVTAQSYGVAAKQTLVRVPWAALHIGANFLTYSKLVNDAVESSETENVIIISDRIIPSAQDLLDMAALLQRHPMVIFCHLRFMGVSKHLFRMLGQFDEHFVGGGWEDLDFIRRLQEAGLSAHREERLHTLGQKVSDNSRWQYSIAEPHWKRKWGPGGQRLLPEAMHSRDFGRSPAALPPWESHARSAPFAVVPVALTAAQVEFARPRVDLALAGVGATKEIMAALGWVRRDATPAAVTAPEAP
jgi:hypothetical protein